MHVYSQVVQECMCTHRWFKNACVLTGGSRMHVYSQVVQEWELADRISEVAPKIDVSEISASAWDGHREYTSCYIVVWIAMLAIAPFKQRVE